VIERLSDNRSAFIIIVTWQFSDLFARERLVGRVRGKRHSFTCHSFAMPYLTTVQFLPRRRDLH